MRIAIGLVIALAGCATAAPAADRPVVGPTPDWVQPAAPQLAPGPAGDAALQVLLSDQQARFSPTATEIYVDSRVRIQTPQGLQSIGTISLSWQPDADVITVHRLDVRRGAEVRDLLGNGDGFTILRREDLLERATLTGTLTAFLQPPDLQVGDIVEFSYTRRHADPVVPDKPDLQFAWFNAPVQSVRFRAQWPKQMPMRWQLRDFKPALQEATTGDIHSIAFTLENPPPLLQPTGAPARFGALRRVEFTAFQSWQEAAQRLAPLYAQASKLSADSPLQAEIARIRAASTDPKLRAAAALRLAQEQVRYVALSMNQGALVPAAADQTWQRRYGDCKAKTALLLALLQGLGIEAEPVAVNTGAGDGIDLQLPAIGAFDHVLVRAQVAGRTYWLDGTRPADRHLDLLEVPDFRWGLPLVARGSGLVRIQPAPLTAPQLLREVNLDASAGVDAPARFQGKAVFRGDTALSIKLSLDNADATQRDQDMRNYWRGDFDGLQVEKVDARFDETAGTLTWTAEGTQKLDWSDDGFFEIGDMNLGYKPDFSRPAGTDTEAPYAVSFPAYGMDRVTVKLPAGPAAFTISGEDIDRTLAGWEYKRKARIAGSVFTAESSARSLVPEIPAQEARAAEAGLREMYKNRLFIVKPRTVPSEEELRSQAGKPLDSAYAYVRRGTDMMERSLHELAIAEFTSALRLEPRDYYALVNRGMSHQRLGHGAEARTDLREALEVKPEDATALGSLGELALKEGRTTEAIDLLSRSLKAEENAYTREQRANAYFAARDVERGTQDLIALAREEPSLLSLFTTRAIELMRQNRSEDVRKLARIVLDARVGPSDGAAVAAGLYLTAGARDQARSVLDTAIAREPTPALFMQRAYTAPNPALTVADFEQALKLDPKFLQALVGLASLRIAMKQYPEALQALDRLEAATPANAETARMRAEVLARMGNVADARKAYEVVRRAAQSPDDFNNLCWSQATLSDSLLDDAMQDCDAALAAIPASAAFLDSRGLVLLKLKRYAEAIASYDAAISARPRLAASLFGRGVAKLRLDMKAEGDADIAAALAISPAAEAAFTEFGIRR